MSTEEPTGEQLFGESLSAVTGPAYVVAPTTETLEEVVGAARGMAEPPTLRVLASGSTLRSFRDRFQAAARAADLVARHGLRFGVLEDTVATPSVIDREAVYAPVIVGSSRSVLSGSDSAFAAEAYEQCEGLWTMSSEFALHTPPLTAIRETMAAEFGTAASEAFDAALGTIERSSDPTAFDEVYAVLLIAGHEELLHYDLSKWGEDIGLASKATFSRKKNELEDWGVLRTEKESIDVGRPRQRLLLTDEYRERVTEEGVAELVTSVVY